MSAPKYNKSYYYLAPKHQRNTFLPGLFLVGKRKTADMRSILVLFCIYVTAQQQT